jgi:hypothetical protein
MRHDFYHLPEYHEFGSAHQERGEPVAFLAEESGSRFFAPFLIRRIPEDIGGDGTLSDAVSTRGYPGPLLSVADEDRADAFVERALGSLKRVLRERGVIAAFFRLHPLFPLPRGSLQRHGEVVDVGDSVVVDLRASSAEMWRMTTHGHRSDINRARRMGWTVRIDEQWEHLDGLAQAYAESMDRLQAEAHWRLTRAYFAGLRDALGERIRLCVVEDGDRLAAAALLTEEDGIAEYHLSGTMDDYVRHSPSKCIIDFARGWAKARGDRVLNLAGSLRRGDSLIAFKLGFSPLQYPVLSWRLVSDEVAYHDLCQAWRARTGVTDPAVDYFPAYRTPAPQAPPAAEPGGPR